MELFGLAVLLILVSLGTIGMILAQIWLILNQIHRIIEKLDRHFAQEEKDEEEAT